jgi:hypothetical protein
MIRVLAPPAIREVHDLAGSGLNFVSRHLANDLGRRPPSWRADASRLRYDQDLSGEYLDRGRVVVADLRVQRAIQDEVIGDQALVCRKVGGEQHASTRPSTHHGALNSADR